MESTNSSSEFSWKNLRVKLGLVIQFNAEMFYCTLIVKSVFGGEQRKASKLYNIFLSVATSGKGPRFSCATLASMYQFTHLLRGKSDLLHFHNIEQIISFQHQ